MDLIPSILDLIAEHSAEKYGEEVILKDTLISIVNNCYYGDFSLFLRDEVLNEDYGTLRHDVKRIYNS